MVGHCGTILVFCLAGVHRSARLTEVQFLYAMPFIWGREGFVEPQFAYLTRLMGVVGSVSLAWGTTAVHTQSRYAANGW